MARAVLHYDADRHEVCSLENLWRATARKARYLSAALIFYRRLPLCIIGRIVDLSHPVTFVTSVAPVHTARRSRSHPPRDFCVLDVRPWRETRGRKKNGGTRQA